MKKILIIIFAVLTVSSSAFAQVGSYAGSFSRMGFGARGLSMGNALVSNIYGDISGYYNPALAAFQDEGFLNLGYTFLSMDRKLNFIGFAKKFNLPNQPKGGAGISLGWINSGVGNIDGRDNDTRSIGTLTTSDNQLYLGTSFLLSENFAVGIGFKYYLSKLFENVTSNSIAFDLGAVVRANENLAFGLSVRDLGAKLEWNTSNIYGSVFGNTTEDKFPTLINFGASYKLPKGLGSVSLESQIILIPKNKDNSNPDKKNEFGLKVGGEIAVNEYLKFRGGLDRINFSNEDFMGNLMPSLGVGFYKNFSGSMKLGLDYSVSLEPFTHNPVQNISVGFKFK